MSLFNLQSYNAGGAITAQNGTVDLTIPAGVSLSALGVGVSGTWTGTIQIEVTAGGAGSGEAYVALLLTLRSAASTVASFTANGQWTASIAGCGQVRARATASMTGSAIVTLNAVA